MNLHQLKKNQPPETLARSRNRSVYAASLGLILIN
jgi:hypothetical protein